MLGCKRIKLIPLGSTKEEELSQHKLSCQFCRC
jgi:hypothetical protein